MKCCEFSNARALRTAALGMALMASGYLCGQSTRAADPDSWQVGLASVCITPETPIRMAGYANRVKPSEGVLSDLYAKALVIRYAKDEPALFFGYLPTARMLEEGGYETRGLIPEIGYFAPEAEQAFVSKVHELAQKAGRKRLG